VQCPEIYWNRAAEYRQAECTLKEMRLFLKDMEKGVIERELDSESSPHVGLPRSLLAGSEPYRTILELVKKMSSS